jgi:K+/H+ antiporter YhaU regulatory subunit KhtT
MKLASTEREIEQAAIAAEEPGAGPRFAGPQPTRPLPGYELLEVRVLRDSPALGRRVGELEWPTGSAVVAITQGREIHAVRPDLRLQAGERVLVLAPVDQTLAA